MALNRFTTEEMAALTATWTDPAHADHRVLTRYPFLAALMPELRAAHEDVLTLRPLLERIASLQGEQLEADDLHDTLLRIVWFRLLSEELMARGDERLVTLIRQIQTLILPHGLATTQKTYREEVGHSERVRAQMTEVQRQLLQRMTTSDGTLLDVVEQWLEVSQRLGELTNARSALLPQVGDYTRSDNSRRRSRWIRIINLLRANATLIEDDDELDELLSRIDKAERHRERLLASRAGAGADDEDGDVLDEDDGDVTDDDDSADATDGNDEDLLSEDDGDSVVPDAESSADGDAVGDDGGAPLSS